MADIVLNANAVGQVITYVAPGYLAYLGYRLRFPGTERSIGEVVIISVAVSLPLVALVNLLPGTQKPTQLGYVSLLLLLGLAVGYLTALARNTQAVRDGLGRVGYRLQPESRIWAQTLYRMSDEATVLVELKDGRRVTGYPRNGPQYKDDGIEELYLVYPEVIDEVGESHPIPAGPGIVLPLSEVIYVVMSEEPTGAPSLEDPDAPDPARAAVSPPAEQQAPAGEVGA